MWSANNARTFKQSVFKEIYSMHRLKSVHKAQRNLSFIIYTRYVEASSLTDAQNDNRNPCYQYLWLLITLATTVFLA